MPYQYIFFPTGIMTAKLLPVFLKCFEDEYISVRSEVCITCGNLEIKDEQVVEKLIHLATFDPIWKVKALAIQGKNYISNLIHLLQTHLGFNTCRM